jgi:hypothetical protein
MISKETLKTIAQGALGSITFGAYHMYVTKSMMEINNERNDEKNRNMEFKNQVLIDNNQIIMKNMMEDLEKMKKDNEELRKKFWF